MLHVIRNLPDGTCVVKLPRVGSGYYSLPTLTGDIFIKYSLLPGLFNKNIIFKNTLTNKAVLVLFFLL